MAGRSGSVGTDSPVATGTAGRGRLAQILHDLPRQKSLYLMTAIGLGMVVLFQYLPIYGMQVAFKRFSRWRASGEAPGSAWTTSRRS